MAGKGPYCSLQPPDTKVLPCGGQSILPGSELQHKRKWPQDVPEEVYVRY